MDFELIEKLEESQINELYDDFVGGGGFLEQEYNENSEDDLLSVDGHHWTCYLYTVAPKNNNIFSDNHYNHHAQNYFAFVRTTYYHKTGTIAYSHHIYGYIIGTPVYTPNIIDNQETHGGTFVCYTLDYCFYMAHNARLESALYCGESFERNVRNYIPYVYYAYAPYSASRTFDPPAASIGPKPVGNKYSVFYEFKASKYGCHVYNFEEFELGALDDHHMRFQSSAEINNYVFIQYGMYRLNYWDSTTVSGCGNGHTCYISTYRNAKYLITNLNERYGSIYLELNCTR